MRTIKHPWHGISPGVHAPQVVNAVIDALPAHFISVLRNYFEQYKVLENKVVRIDEFQPQQLAYQIITEAISYYGKKFTTPA